MGRLDVRGSSASSQTSAALLRRARDADRDKQFAVAAQLAGQAAAADPRNLMAWRLLGVLLEKLGDYAGSLEAYDQALALSPDDATLARDLARLAGLVDMPELAERFLLRARRLDPASLEIINDLACAYCAQARFSEAIDLLRESLTLDPGSALLWNTLGCVLFEQGQAGPSIVFFDEAIRLDAGMDAARFNRANARKAVGDVRGALEDCGAAIALGADQPAQDAMYRYAQSLLLLTAGEIGAGWDAYAVRNEEAYPDYVQHRLTRPGWAGEPLAGKSLLVMGEQGLGDEVLFANVLTDVAREIGPTGQLLIAVEPRLVTMFQRSFGTAQVLAYETNREGVQTIREVPALPAGSYDMWARLGDLMARHRRSLSDFPTSPGGFLKADPGRIEHWRAVLASHGPGPKVGVIWRSLVINAQRQKFYPPLEHWEPVFRTPGVTFVNLQLGDCSDELRVIAHATGAELKTLPDIDLRTDLDDLAALSCALDLVIGPATATTNIAAAVGAPTWFATTPDAWPRLGTAAFPWYPQARAFSGQQAYDWASVMAAVGAALRAEFPAPG